MHPRNRHHGRYDFTALTVSYPELGAFVVSHPLAGVTIDFSDPLAVRALNTALLKHMYGLSFWQIPANYLCPPIPGRVDYLHYAADLVKGRGPSIRVLDIGVGANCIYPLLGHQEYGWSFVGSDISAEALVIAGEIVEKNSLAEKISLRHQPTSHHILRGVIETGEYFDLSVCNPPFFASKAQADEEASRKWRHLDLRHKQQQRNFGGKAAELWCAGGEARFLRQLAFESAEYQSQVGWFSSLVAKHGHLREFDRALEKSGARERRVFEMEQGQKKSRMVAWTFKS